ncbi:hypothetical protein SLS62_003599 [Diatrype stigma]|uniref:Mitochondrial transcription factor 1 n=1 Tax=Diatrype stigma TaxID=117547 RepID=A0AAN9UVL3_9PEZI
MLDDILKYLGSDFKERHEGCDIIDIYPGAGVWSQKVHDLLNPRSHILMEPDEELYRPFLQPILDQPGSILVPKSGIVWRDLNSILTPEYLPHQVPVKDTFKPNQRNDTLLVIANIAFHPPKKYKSFNSLALLVFHQLINSIHTSSLFQKYGQVRMLVWSRQEDTAAFLPRNMQRRRRSAMEAELYCEWVREVCGRDGPESLWYIRDNATETYSSLLAAERMEEAGLVVPKGRESKTLREVQAARPTARKEMAKLGSVAPEFQRSFMDTLAALEQKHQTKLLPQDSDEYKTMKGYAWRLRGERKKWQTLHNLVSALDNLHAKHKDRRTSPAKLQQLEDEWHTAMHSQTSNFKQEFITYRDNLHFIRQYPPLLQWDQRPYEPLVAQADEFFPNVECALVDIQPRDVHPLLRQVGPDSNRAADTLELVMSGLLAQSTTPLGHALDIVWPGAADYIMPRWSSIADGKNNHGMPCREGVKRSTYGMITARMLNARQWEQLIELWMEWPFRPELHDLIARTTDTEDPYAVGVMGSAVE